MLHDMGQRVAIHAIDTPYTFLECAVLSAHQLAVESEHGRLCGSTLWKGIVGTCRGVLHEVLLQPLVEGLCLGLCDALLVVVAGRREQQVVALALVDTLGHDVGTEDEVEEFFRGLGEAAACDERLHVLSREARLELVAAIVVVNAVGEPDTLEINLKSPELLRGAGALEIHVYALQQLSEGEIAASVLVPQDVASPQCCLCEMEHKLFLTQ